MKTKRSMPAIRRIIFLLAFACAFLAQAPAILFAANPPMPSGMDFTLTPTKETQKEVIAQQEAIVDEKIFLNFQDVSLQSVLDYLAEDRKVDGKKMNIIPNPELANIKVSLMSKTSFTRAQAWDVLLTLLETNKYTIVKVGDTHRVLPTSVVPQEPLPVLGGEISNLPNNDQIVRYLYFLRNIKTDMVADIIRTMVGDRSLMLHKDLGMLIITAPSKNIRAAMKIVEALDTGGLSESIQVLQIKYHDAEAIEALFNDQIIGNQQRSDKGIQIITPQSGRKEARYFSPTTRVISDATKNRLILMGQLDEIEKVKFFIQKCLDLPQDSADSRLHVKDIKFLPSDKLMSLLQKSITRPRGTGNDKSPLVGDFKFFEDVAITAETPASGDDKNYGSGNRLIIACSRDDWKRLEALINRLDKPVPQVALEVMIVDVTLNSVKTLGAQTRLKKGDQLGLDIGMQAYNSGGTTSSPTNNILPNLAASLPANNVGSLLTLGPTAVGDTPGNVYSLISAILTNDNTNIVSQPFLLVNNRETCSLENNTTRSTDGEIDASGGRQQRRKKEIPAVTSVSITPRINVTGTVDLSINVNVTDFTDSVVTSANTTNRSLETRVTMGTGEVLILGGMTTSKLVEKTYKTPILGDIPLLGFFFRYKTKQPTKSNLYVFVRPSVVKPHIEGAPDDYTQLKLDYAKYQLLNLDTVSSEADPIQRWFFKPSRTKMEQKAADLKSGVFRPLDNFTVGKDQPISVDLARDSFYRPAEATDARREADIVRNLKAAAEKEAKINNKVRNKQLSPLPAAPVNNALHQEFEQARALWKEKGWKQLPFQT